MLTFVFKKIFFFVDFLEKRKKERNYIIKSMNTCCDIWCFFPFITSCPS